MKQFILFLFAFLLLCTGAEAANRFGICATTCTWDASSTAMWSATSGGATGASVPSSSDTVTFNASTCVGGTTCTITVNTNPTIQSLSMGACTATTTGCVLDFSVNNNNFSLVNGVQGSFDISGSGTRVVKLGSGTFTFFKDSTGTNKQSWWTAQVTTNLTLQAGTSTILYTGTSAGTIYGLNNQIFHGGSLTYATVTLASDVGSGSVEIDGSNTFGTLNIAGPNTVYFGLFQTQTITSPIAWAGSSSQWIYIAGSAQSSISPAVIAQGAANAAMSWVGFRAISMTGGGTHIASNSLDFGGNVGMTINPPAGITDPNSGPGSCILGGWLLWRDMPDHINDNFPAWLEKAA